MSIQAYIVDDELHNIENLTHLLKTHCGQVVIVGSAERVADAKEEIERLQPNLLFLDIRLHQETGFDLLKQIPLDNIEVIFITAFDQYGVQAVKYAALDYLLKPLDSEELKNAVQKASDKISYRQENEQLRFLVQELSVQKTRKIALPMQQEVRYTSLADIIRFEASNNYTYIFLQSGEKLLIAKTLKEYADLLSPVEFLRTHQSHLINKAYIRSWLKEDGGILLLVDGTRIPVSRMNKEKIKNLLNR